MTLCPACAHVRRVETGRGSVFWMCERSKSDPDRYAKYPPQPVMRCPGFAPREGVDPPR